MLQKRDAINSNCSHQQASNTTNGWRYPDLLKAVCGSTPAGASAISLHPSSACQQDRVTALKKRKNSAAEGKGKRHKVKGKRNVGK
jgi:hypothetical protein